MLDVETVKKKKSNTAIFGHKRKCRNRDLDFKKTLYEKKKGNINMEKGLYNYI